MGAVVVRGVDVRAGVRDGLDLFDGPALAVGVDQVGRRHAEELLHLGQPFAVVADVVDLAPAAARWRPGARAARSGRLVCTQVVAWAVLIAA